MASGRATLEDGQVWHSTAGLGLQRLDLAGQQPPHLIRPRDHTYGHVALFDCEEGSDSSAGSGRGRVIGYSGRWKQWQRSVGWERSGGGGDGAGDEMVLFLKKI